ncbi:N-acetyltransferase [bacterium]|nr:N-acetyltransferase [bacterium]
MKVTDKIEIGEDCQIDEGVILGYISGRKIASLMTIIGHRAKIRTGTVIYAGLKIGDNLETGHNVVIREENIIGDNFNIWNNSTVDYGCQIGNNVKIHNNVYLAQFTILEDDVFLAPGVITGNDPHPICTKCMKGPTIRKGARIGINATLFPRIVIGEHCLIGAGAVVTRDVPPQSVVYGNPARVVCSTSELKCKQGMKEKPYFRR